MEAIGAAGKAGAATRIRSCDRVLTNYGNASQRTRWIEDALNVTVQPRMMPVRANSVGRRALSPTISASIAACHSRALGSAVGSLVIQVLASFGINS
jgi:hypothetical protein